MLLFLAGFVAGCLFTVLGAYTLLCYLDPYSTEAEAQAFLETFGGQK